MNWITLSNGGEHRLADPNPDDICVETLVHHISQIVRFNGGAKRPYSVAEHSLLCLDIAERYLDLDAKGLLCVLVHDLHEAMCGDQTTPTKAEIGKGWTVLEDRLERAVLIKLDLLTARFENGPEILFADRAALAMEDKQLLPPLRPDGTPRTPWPCLKNMPLLDHINLMDSSRVAMTWQDWRDAFMERFTELDCARRLDLKLAA